MKLRHGNARAHTHTHRHVHRHTCSHSNNGELVGTWKNPMYATIRLYGLLSQVKCFSAAHWRCIQTVSYGWNEARLIKAAFPPLFLIYMHCKTNEMECKGKDKRHNEIVKIAAFCMWCDLGVCTHLMSFQITVFGLAAPDKIMSLRASSPHFF